LTFQPVIKWTGSKRTQSKEIVSRFPKKIRTYYEPFVGGGSVLRQLLDSDVEVESYRCSDINNDLISLWNMIKDNPKQLVLEYTSHWEELNLDSDIDRRKVYFNKVRDDVNKNHLPGDFLFISRTVIQGLVRYNRLGNLNAALHLTRPGIHPHKLAEIIWEWSESLDRNDVAFECKSYEKIQLEKGDYGYFDPPYAATGSGMYYGGLDYSVFWEWLRKQKSGYILSFDGKTDTEDSTYAVPKDVYDTHEYLLAGHGGFRQTVGLNSLNIYESLYVKH
jgi:DNA adenine methylase